MIKSPHDIIRQHYGQAQLKHLNEAAIANLMDLHATQFKVKEMKYIELLYELRTMFYTGFSHEEGHAMRIKLDQFLKDRVYNG